MTRDQKLALLNLVFFLLFGVVLVLEDMDVLHGLWSGGVLIFSLGLAAMIGAVILNRRTSRKKGVVADERDRLFGNRSFVAAYFALMVCLLAGPLAAGILFRGEPIPLNTVLKWVAGSWVISMLVQSGVTLFQYGLRIKGDS